MSRLAMCLVLNVLIACTPSLFAQSQSEPAPAPDHQHMDMAMPEDSSGWQFMQDGTIYALVNHQGGPRGGDEFVAPNWWMGMAARRLRSSQLTLNAMFSLDAATVGRTGYRELFQTGEALDGEPLIDRQHPHDFFMQLAGAWRVPLSPTTGLTLAGGPSGEPTLGPPAFMHRASAAGIPFAPLSHHVFDSTHVSFGVVAAALDHGRWTVEASVFNGREPDDSRWDFDFGRMDSVSGRVWFRPATTWELQVSTGHLVQPEELEPGDVERTTASASWFQMSDRGFAALTMGYGVNAAEHANRHAAFGEFSRRAGLFSLAFRLEILQVESALLLDEMAPDTSPSTPPRDVLGSLTVGGAREMFRLRGFEGAVGANGVFYAVPSALEPAYDSHPFSFQVFFELRPAAGSSGRMWNMRMTQAMPGHAGH